MFGVEIEREDKPNLTGKKYECFVDKLNFNRGNEHLTKWKKFLEELCKERGEEIDLIWFDVSTPYDDEINIRLKGHRCWNSCVNFRFRDGVLKAFDSHFSGGTSMIWSGKVGFSEEDEIRKVMDKVFNKECSNSSWEDRDDDSERKDKHREIKIDEFFWNTDENTTKRRRENKEEKAKLEKKENKKKDELSQTPIIVDDNEKAIQEICESVSRHFSGDYIIHTLYQMKERGETDSEMFKWYVKTCNTYGSGSPDGISFMCNSKGVDVSRPFSKVLKWRDVYNRAKKLPVNWDKVNESKKEREEKIKKEKEEEKEEDVEDDIKETSTKLKELLKKKYGFEVKIIVEKGVKNE